MPTFRATYPPMKEHKIITPETDTLAAYLRKVWRFRSLIGTFARRDIQIKYAQTWLGVGWSILQPAVAIVVYTVFFTLVVKIPFGETHYILFVLSGLALWTLFSYIFGQGIYVLQGNQDVIRKMAFPKIILLLAKVLVGLVEFGVSFVLLLVAWAIWGSLPGWRVLLMPIPVLGIILMSLALTLLLLGFSLKRRDLLHIGPFLVYFGIWLTPVFYPVSLLPERYKEWIYLNPVAAMIDFFRWTIGVQGEFSPLFPLAFFVILVLFFVALFLFKNREDSIVDNL